LSPEIAAKSPQKSPQKTGSKVTQKERPGEGLYIDARIGSSINNFKLLDKVFKNKIPTL
jgi:hypothetical protein